MKSELIIFNHKILSDYDKNSYEEIAKRTAGENISLYSKKLKLIFFCLKMWIPFINTLNHFFKNK